MSKIIDMLTLKSLRTEIVKLYKNIKASLIIKDFESSIIYLGWATLIFGAIYFVAMLFNSGADWITYPECMVKIGILAICVSVVWRYAFTGINLIREMEKNNVAVAIIFGSIVYAITLLLSKS